LPGPAWPGRRGPAAQPHRCAAAPPNACFNRAPAWAATIARPGRRTVVARRLGRRHRFLLLGGEDAAQGRLVLLVDRGGRLLGLPPQVAHLFEQRSGRLAVARRHELPDLLAQRLLLLTQLACGRVDLRLQRFFQRVNLLPLHITQTQGRVAVSFQHAQTPVARQFVPPLLGPFLHRTLADGPHQGLLLLTRQRIQDAVDLLVETGVRRRLGNGSHGSRFRVGRHRNRRRRLGRFLRLRRRPAAPRRHRRRFRLGRLGRRNRRLRHLALRRRRAIRPMPDHHAHGSRRKHHDPNRRTYQYPMHRFTPVPKQAKFSPPHRATGPGPSLRPPWPFNVRRLG